MLGRAQWWQTRGIEESEPMDLREHVRLLRRRWRLIAVCVLLAVAAATAYTASATRVYTARAQLFVSAQEGSGSDISSVYTGGLFTQARVKSYVSLIMSVRTASLVRDDLELSESPEAISKRIIATAPLETVLINLAVSDASPRRAQAIANALGRVFPAEVNRIETPPSGGPSPVRVTLVQSAGVPTEPTSPRPTLNLALGLLLGLAAGVASAFLRESLDTSVKGSDQARDLVGAPVLGAINYDTDAPKKPLVVVSAPNSSRAEAFRQLRTNLQFVDIEHPLRSVVFTSSIPGEGKSTTTCNLAITLTQAGLRVVLVEGDLRRPRIADYMGMEGAVGLTSVLLGRTTLDDALQPWGDGSLQVLASGPLPPNPSELLGSQGMQDLLRELERRADIVLIDAPPLLPVTDAAVLGTLTSGIVMLVRSNTTRREQVASAVATVAAVGGTMLGAVLNMVPTRGPDSYSYGYGYSYKSSAGAHRLAEGESPVGSARRPSPSDAVAGLDQRLQTSRPGAESQPQPQDLSGRPPSAPHPVLAELLSQPTSVPPSLDLWGDLTRSQGAPAPSLSDGYPAVATPSESREGPMGKPSPQGEPPQSGAAASSGSES
jgi:capsular exopolysaccharide synthesis family protein